MTFSLFLDVVVAILLVATIVYAAMLNRRLSGLRSNKAELEALIHSFGEACARAEAGVKTLRTATDEATRLQQYLDRSQALRDDLAFLLDRGSQLADRLEGGVRTARTEVQSRPAPAPEAEPAAATGRFGRRQGLGGLGGVADADPRMPRPLRERALSEAPVEAPMAMAADPAPIDSAERAAERLAQRVAMGERPARVPRGERAPRERPSLRTAMGEAAAPGALEAAAAAPRSKAERELLQALRTRR